MDWTPIITSLITGVVTALGTILGFIATSKENKRKAEEAHNKRIEDLQANLERKMESDRQSSLEAMRQVNAYMSRNSDNLSELRAQTQQFQAVIELRITELSDRVNKHNSIVERTYALEKQVGILDNREKVSEHRLDDLESDGK